MIKLLTDIEVAQREIENLIGDIQSFSDCRFEKPAFKNGRKMSYRSYRERMMHQNLKRKSLDLREYPSGQQNGKTILNQ